MERMIVWVRSGQTADSGPLLVLELNVFTLELSWPIHEVVVLLFGVASFGLSRAHHRIRLLYLLTDLRKVERAITCYFRLGLVVVEGVPGLRLVHAASLRSDPLLGPHSQDVRPTVGVGAILRTSGNHLGTLQLYVGFVDKMLLHYILNLL